MYISPPTVAEEEAGRNQDSGTGGQSGRGKKWIATRSTSCGYGQDLAMTYDDDWEHSWRISRLYPCLRLEQLLHAADSQFACSLSWMHDESEVDFCFVREFFFDILLHWDRCSRRDKTFTYGGLELFAWGHWVGRARGKWRRGNSVWFWDRYGLLPAAPYIGQYVFLEYSLSMHDLTLRTWMYHISQNQWLWCCYMQRVRPFLGGRHVLSVVQKCIQTMMGEPSDGGLHFMWKVQQTAAKLVWIRPNRLKEIS